MLPPAFILLTLPWAGAARGFCWKPGTTPFNGQPQVSRSDDGNVRIDWTNVFNDNDECKDVDFLVMIQPKDNPSAYTLSDFVPRGRRSMIIPLGNPEADYTFQVIAREDKAPSGIDYKYSDMVINYSAEEENRSQETEDATPAERPEATATQHAPPLLPQSDNPWYIYECVPFLKNVEGFPDFNVSKHNQALVHFIRHVNLNPLETVRKFLSSKGSYCDARGPGYVSGCRKCCPTPFDASCEDESCFEEHFACDGGRCVPKDRVDDGWPDCFDGTDEQSSPVLPQQLLCIHCAGVVLSAGFICRESRKGLTKDCVHEAMGRGGGCNQCVKMYLNLS